MLITLAYRSQLYVARCTAQHQRLGCPAIINDIQACSEQCLLLQLAHVGARTDTMAVPGPRGSTRAEIPYASVEIN